MKESDRLKFNELFKQLLTDAKKWVAAGKALDDKLIAIEKEMVKVGTSDGILKSMKHVTDSIKQR